MRNWWLAGLVWWIFGVSCPAGAENRGGTEVEVRQGTLSRWAAWWSPAPGDEARCWWEPGGGAAWLKVGEFQFGPLQEVPGSEGAVVWGPAARQTGVWGAAWSGPVAGAWALQKTETLEAGFRVSWGTGAGTLGAGVSRTWDLGLCDPGPRWTDRGFAGGTWTKGFWKGGAEVRAAAEEAGPLLPVLSGRLSAGSGPWDLEGKVQASGSGAWTARWRFRWDEGGWRFEGSGDRTEGVMARADAEWAFGTLTASAGAQVRYREELWTGSAGVGAAAKAERGRWKLGWTLTPDPILSVQRVEASWKEPGLEASADWTVEGLRLGWFGPGSRLTWKLRWLY